MTAFADIDAHARIGWDGKWSLLLAPSEPNGTAGPLSG
jgi:hypothetical protein